MSAAVNNVGSSSGSVAADDPQQLQQQNILLQQRVRILEGECKELDKARTAEKAQRERCERRKNAHASLPCDPLPCRCTLLAAKIAELEAQLRKSLADLKLAQVVQLSFASRAAATAPRVTSNQMRRAKGQDSPVSYPKPSTVS